MEGMATRTGPRERMAGAGAQSLADEELLTLLVSPGTRSLPGPALAAAMLADAGSLRRLAERRPRELAALRGVGLAKACRVLAALELGRRALVPDDAGAPLLGAADVARRCARVAHDPVESFVAMAVNARNRVTGQWVVARGWESGVNLTPRQVFTLLVKESAGRVVFVHNHPSGDPAPSVEDVRFTARLLEAARCLDIRVLDHVVVSPGGFASLRETPGLDLAFG
jgi:DNA repair protein RadC